MASTDFDIAIIGGGAAGLTTALSLSPALRVAVIAKRPLAECASAWAQGGIAAVLTEGDSFAAHIADTLRAGAGLCAEAVVREIVAEAPGVIAWLERQGAAFNHRGSGYDLGREGGHSARRIAHVDDTTGRAVIAALVAKVKAQKNIALLENNIAVSLHVDGGRCGGLHMLHLPSGTVQAIGARAVMLASGGASKVYLYATTPPDATGDGVAMAFRAGCGVRNMEFVQFHPTCLYHPLASSFLITEAMRGEGARLVNEEGRYFMNEAHEDAELAPRDIVARAIDQEMKRSGADCVYLDLSAHGGDFWRRRFPAIVQRCADWGMELPRDHIPVVPAAHYCCGGVRTDVDGRTDVAGLFAAGEVACNGLHGANRLASNSLLECVAVGRRAAAAMEDGLPETISPPPPWDERRISASTEDVMVAQNWEELRLTMWNYVGIARSDERLQRARVRIEWIREEIEDYYRRHIVSRDFLELRNLAQCAELIVEGALSRRESRGLHFNADCPQTAAAADTVLHKRDFQKRARTLNRLCPFSQRPVVANGMMDYRGGAVGFCNPGCRDSFARAVAADFVGVDDKMLAARNYFDAYFAAGG